jgi:hypothetical protein
MSTIKVTNVQDTSGGSSSTSAEIFKGRAKAWVNFNGTGTVAIRTSFNVASISDLGTGQYTINFTNAVSSDCCPVMFNSAWATGAYTNFDNHYTGGITTGTTNVQVSSFSGSWADSNQFFVVIFGD